MLKPHIQKMMDFATEHDPTIELENLSAGNPDDRTLWKREKERNQRNWQSIHSCEDVKKLIDCFERIVNSAPADLLARQNYRCAMLIAEYRVLRGLRKWCNSLNTIPTLRKKAFPEPSEAEVDALIARISAIIQKI